MFAGIPICLPEGGKLMYQRPIAGPKRPTNHKLLRVVPFAYHQLINRQHAGTNYERINMQSCVM